MKPTILILLSDIELSIELSAICRNMDWSVAVSTVAEWEEQINPVSVPNLVLISMQYPEIDGLSLCWQIRQVYNSVNTKVVMLSKATDLYVEVSALNTGVDEFLRLPIPNQLFKAKLFAWRRGLNIPIGQSSKLTIDKERHLVIKDAKPYRFSKKEFEVISVLATRPKVVFSRSDIKRAIWSDSDSVSDRLIDVYVRNLRKRLGESTIHTVKGIGYSLQMS